MKRTFSIETRFTEPSYLDDFSCGELKENQCQPLVNESMARLLHMLIDSRNPLATLMGLMYNMGYDFSLYQLKTQEDIANHLNMSKQGFNKHIQHTKRLLKQWNNNNV